MYELIVLTVARHWSAQYAWAVHEPIARGLGFSADDDRGDPAPAASRRSRSQKKP